MSANPLRARLRTAASQRILTAGLAVAATAALATATLAVGAPASAAASPYAARVNSGGPAWTAPDGTAWSADGSYSYGDVVTRAVAIANTPYQTLYQTQRYGMLNYKLKVPNGGYNVTLRFAETFYSAPGQRKFSVDIEGKRVLTNYDIYAAAGAKNRAVDVVVPVSVADGELTIGFVRNLANPTIAAIDAVATSTATTTTAPASTTTTTKAPSTTTTTKAPTTTTTAPALAPAPTTTAPPATGTNPLTATGGVPFANPGPFTSPIPAGAATDANSAAIMSYLTGSATGIVADLYEFGIPIYYADASTPRFNVTCTMNWGTCGLQKETVPIPANAVPNVGDDGVMQIVDFSTRKSYEFWQAKNTNGVWTASWGSVMSIDSVGNGGSATGAGFSRLAGVVRTREIAAGSIPHPLVMSTNNSCSGVLRYPATKTDGSATTTNCIPEGARIQLDPTINVDAIPGITPGEKAIAKALQTYRAYNMDNGGARMAFSFEKPAAGSADPYPGAGFAWDYYNMPHIPWKSVRVLSSWNGA